MLFFSRYPSETESKVILTTIHLHHNSFRALLILLSLVFLRELDILQNNPLVHYFDDNILTVLGSREWQVLQALQ